MKPDLQNDFQITQKAAEWLFALPYAGAADQAAFGTWLRASPRHVEEFLMVSAAYNELGQLSGEETFSPDELRAALAADVVAFPGSLQGSRSENRRKWIAVGAAAGVAGILIAAYGLLPVGFLAGQSYSTTVGEMRSFELPDGSIIELNTSSRMRVSFSERVRKIHLHAGEAAFKVARDPSRPFSVHAGSAVIQAIGTEFTVYRRTQGTTVSVLEGAVRVFKEGSVPTQVANSESKAEAGQVLATGQGARITPAGKITKLATADRDKATAWRQRRLIFRGETLAEVAAEFNRYNHVPQIRVEGELARNLPLAGIFDANDPESLIVFLTRHDLSIERDDGSVVIRSP